MRIALLTRRFDPEGGGTERDLMITAQCLQRCGHEIVVYAEEIRAEAPGMRVRRVGAIKLPRTAAFLRFAFTAAPLARREGTDLVLSFARVVNADVLRSGGGAHASYLRAAAQWRGRAGAAAMRLAPYHAAQLMVERHGFASPLLRNAIAVSEFVRTDLIGQFSLPPGRVVTIYNGVDLQRFHPAGDPAARNEVRARFGIPAGAKLVLFVGNGFGRKGLGSLIDALAKFRDAPHLIVVGSDRDVASFRRRAERNGVAARVTFAGTQSSVERFFNASDAFVFPSLFEPFGNVAMEAMACGLPVLASSRCGVAELMPAALRGFVVDNPADAGEIARKLDLMLQGGPELGQIARAAAEQFTWERHERELNQFVAALK
ncbi:MAG TPA: glycosyltransferase family 4 protein [Candidatus Binataceae bacterium]|nr:glycosyltransferase family 4 protein [Candidatus Binataceae bacterium]